MENLFYLCKFLYICGVKAEGQPHHKAEKQYITT
nr:MAG TPA: hypothetical protein [Caudoviricetes sp.]